MVARCTVERLMRERGCRGVTRRKKVRTTEPDPSASRAPDLVDRQFRVPAPNMLLVADFTYVRLVTGVFVYTAFVVDAYAGRILGWECSTSKAVAFVESAIRQAAAIRGREGHPLTGDTIHHSDAGSQYTAWRLGETLMLSGMVPSIGSVGDAYDNALAETTIGLYKWASFEPGDHGLLGGHRRRPGADGLDSRPRGLLRSDGRHPRQPARLRQPPKGYARVVFRGAVHR